jgi:hypothetical protein
MATASAILFRPGANDGKFVVAEVALRYAGGQNQIVIGDWDVSRKPFET